MESLPLEQLGVDTESLRAHGIALAILVVANIPVYFVLAKVFFNDLGEFGQAILYWFTPDGWSFLRGTSARTFSRS